MILLSLHIVALLLVIDNLVCWIEESSAILKTLEVLTCSYNQERISNRVNPDDDLDDLFICINTSVGADAARVQRVHLHPLKFGNGYNAPILNQLRVLGYSYHILIWKLKSWFWCKRGSAPNYAPPVLWNPCICPLHNVLDPLISTQFWKSEHK